MKVAVTGGRGFIGTHVVNNLLDRGHTPVVFDPRYQVPPMNTWCEYRMGDVRDPIAVTELAAHVDGIIHLAAVLGTQETVDNPSPAAMTNVIGTLNVLDAARLHDLPMVNIAVGNWFAQNPYSITKNAAERFVCMYRDEHNLLAANVRCVNAYGPGQAAPRPFGSAKVRKITPSFICNALSGRPIEVYGDGKQVSDMVYVADVAEALVRTLEECNNGNVPSQTIEIGPWSHTTVVEVATLIGMLVPESKGILHLDMRPGEDPSKPVTCNSETLRKIDMDPTNLVSLKTGLETTIEWFRRNEGVTWWRSPR